MKLRHEHIRFLEALEEAGPTFRKGLPAACNAQKSARQDCITWKLAKYDNSGWRILPAGRSALLKEDR